MELRIPCGTWIKEADEKVLLILRESDRWLTTEELCERTGLPPHKVAHTLRMLKQQRGYSNGRKKLFLGESDS